MLIPINILSIHVEMIIIDISKKYSVFFTLIDSNVIAINNIINAGINNVIVFFEIIDSELYTYHPYNE